MSAAVDSEVQRLRCKLKEAEESLQKAAQYGLQLLDDQLDLQNRLEEQRTEMTNSIEALEQEKYSLQRELELRGRMLDSLRSECESIKTQQKMLWVQQEAQLERSYTLEIGEYKNKLEKMKAELDEARLSERQLRHKLELQAEALSSKTEELRMMAERSQETLSSEMMELQMEKAELETAKAALEHELNEMSYREQQLQLAGSHLQRTVERLTREKEDCEKEVVSHFNALEEPVRACSFINRTWDMLLMRMQDPNQLLHLCQTVLLQDTPDMQAHLTVTAALLQYSSSDESQSDESLNSFRGQVQIATLMQMKGCQADPGQLERLQSMLAQKNNEIEALMIKLRRLERAEMTIKAEPSSAPSGEGDSGDMTYYTDLLKMQLSNSVKEAERLGEELSVQRMKALAESQRVLEVERRLFSSERTLRLCQSENIRLQVQLDELRMKYQPNAVNKSQVAKRRREKLPVDVPAEADAPEPKVSTAQFFPDQAHGRLCVIVTTSQLLHATCFVYTTSASLKKQETDKILVLCEECPTQPQICTAKRVQAFASEHTSCAFCLSNTASCIFCTSSNMSPPSGTTVKAEEVDAGAENRREERKKEMRPQPVIHVSSKPTLENQCAQQ
uniref:Protein Spindly n=1 Tax=Lepisosteus oculatus TaxID=7918 RepID=W5N2P6_LEPOC